MVGLTIKVLLFPINVPPHVPEYQYQLAFVPKFPPFIPKVTELPEQILVEPGVIEFA